MKTFMIIIGLLFSLQMLQANEERTVELNAGYNAVQFDANITLEELKSKIGIEKLLSIQGAGQGSTYKKQYKDEGKLFLNSFTQTEFGKAYWIKVTDDVTFSYIPDIYKGSKNIDLTEGWNFTGPISVLTLSEIQEQLGIDNLLVIQGAGQGRTYKKSYVDDGTLFLNSFTAFEEGQGYWVKVESSASLTFIFESESMNKIKAYAENSNNPIPLLQDYIDAGVTGVTEDNLNTVNQAVEALDSEAVDTVAKLDDLVIRVTAPCISLEDLKNKIENDEDVTYVNTGCITTMSKLFEEKRDFNQDISTWDVSNVTNMSYMFHNARSFNQDISSWNISHVSDMRGMFKLAISFNQNIGDWNTSNVNLMWELFRGASSFNQPIGNWDVSNVRHMFALFCGASSFNQAIGNWDVSHVTSMYSMFRLASSFNQDIGDWDVSHVNDMGQMFTTATLFNHPIGNWNVSNVRSMRLMFDKASSFNQPLENWNVSNVQDMQWMFTKASSFNQSLENWSVTKVTDMSYMFSEVIAFNQPLENWDVSNVTKMGGMFHEALLFNQPIGTWDVSKVEDMSNMFRGKYNYWGSDNGVSTFNQDISNWDTSKVTDMAYMFSGASAFNQNIGSWDVANVTSMYAMFNRGAILSVDNYDALLIGWSNQSLQSNVTFTARGSQYSSNASSYREYIIDTYGWTILYDIGLN